jgi:cyclophilin family peptidyl-prolyl cis-trans isomerase
MSTRRNHPPTGRFIPGVESLEDRTVPAGNVQVMVGDGVLYVSGDDQGNQLSIAGAGKNSVVIRPLDDTTTLNGRSGPLFVGGIKRGYHIDLFGGDDILTVTSTRSNGALKINMGEGNNVVGISDAGHKKETVINTGAGADTINLHASFFRRAVFINTGAGDDQVAAARVGVHDLYMMNPAGNDFFDNQGAVIGRPNFTGFNLGVRPAPVAPPAPGTPPDSPPASPPAPPAPDTQAPATAFALVADNGASNTDRVTNDPRINVTITDASAITTLRAGFDSASSASFTDVRPNLASDGTLSLTTAIINTINGGVPLTDGPHTLQLQVGDAAGNTDTRQFTFTLDTLAPGEPIYDLAPLSDTGITGDLRTENDVVTLTGVAEAGITLQLSRAVVPGTPGSGAIVATTTAGANGSFVFNNVSLNVGPNSYVVRAVDLAGNVGGTLAQTFTRNTPPVVDNPVGDQTLTVGNSVTIDLGNDEINDVFRDAEIVARLETTYPTGQTGNIDIHLFGDQAPATVANFLSYVNNPVAAGNYDNSVFHRLQTGFVLQGGGFKFDENGTTTSEVFPPITTILPVANQPGVSNTRGTLGMAKSAPDNATSQFFFNLDDNSGPLDNPANAGGFTVFAQVMGGTQDTVDDISTLTPFDSGSDPFRQFPVRTGADTNPFPADLTAADVALITDASQLNGAQRMTFQVINDTNQGVVMTSINATTGELTITGQTAGTTTLTVRATDLDGSQTTTTINVTVN